MGEQKSWAIFDTFMVSIQAIDIVSKVMPTSSLPGNMSILRLLRILRILRIARALRMLRLFEVLAVVVNSMSSSVAPAFWSLMLLLMMIYVCSVFFLQIVCDVGNQS